MKREFYLPPSLSKHEALIRRVWAAAEPYYSENDAAHDFDHALRVTHLALQIGLEEGADPEVLALAGILHDTARHEEELTGVCHARKGAEIAEVILREMGYDTAKSRHIAAMIRTHRFRGEEEPATLEARVLFDADKLDAIGAIGIGRSYAIAGLRGQRMYSPSNSCHPGESSREYSPVEEYRFKLRKVIDKMLTPAGERLARKRHDFMIRFFEELAEEVDGWL